MDYPNNFNVPSFPAGKTVALSRSVSIWISITFFLIVAACCFILLGIHFKTNYPFLISIDPITDEWNIIAYPNESKQPIEQYKIIQEQLADDFVLNWFTISNDKQINESRWESCSIEECSLPEQFNSQNTNCALACRCSAEVFKEFTTKVLPTYKEITAQSPEVWQVKKQFTPIIVSENSGKWQVYATVISTTRKQKFDVLGFIDIARDVDSYPATFGYYVKQFNSYRITK